MSTLASTPRSQVITVASASAGPFDLDFRLFSHESLLIYVDNVKTTAFTVSSSFTDGYDDAATITFDTALAVADVVAIEAVPDYSRAEDLLAGPNLVENMNAEETRQMASIADLVERSKRSIGVPPGSASTDLLMPVPSAGKYLVGREDGLGWENALDGATRHFTTRALLRSGYASSASSDGTLLSDGRVLYMALAGATVISDLPGLVPFGRPDLRHWTDNDGDGLTSVSAAVTEIIAYLAGSLYFGDGGGCYIPPGLWLLTGTTSPWFTIRDSQTFYGAGNHQSCFVFNETDDVIFLVQPENVTTTTTALMDVNFRDLGLLNTTNPSNPFGGNAPVIANTMTALTYDRAMGRLDSIMVRDAQIDLLGNPEGMRLTNCDTGSNNIGSSPGPLTYSAHIRIRPRQIASAIGASYQWTSGTGFDGNYYTYPNSVYITNHNLRAGALAAIDQTEATVIVEAVDGLYVTNGHIAWGSTAPLLVRPRHAQSPITNIQCVTVLFDPLPGKSVNGIKAHDYWSQTTTPASDWDFQGCIVAGCTRTGVDINLPMTGFNWDGGAVKGVATTNGFAMRFAGGVNNPRVTNTLFRNVGASSSDVCVYLDDCVRPRVDGLVSGGATYALVKGTSNVVDGVIGTVQATSLSGGETIEIPALGAQFTVSDQSQIAETQTIAAATTIKPPLGGPGAYITGTGTIETIDTSVLHQGRRINLRPASAPTLNENGNLLLGADSLTLQQGQAIDLVYDTTLNKCCLVGSVIESGTWTPVVSDGTNEATSAAGTTGTYTKTSDGMALRGVILLSSLGSMSGNMQITGLPYAAVGHGGGGTCHYVSGLSMTNAAAVHLRILNGTDYASFYVSDGTGNYTSLQHTDLTASARFEFSIIYDMSA